MSFDDIIDKVKPLPQLWQQEHPLYKNKVVRMNLWRQISKELKADEQHLRKSWKYLTDQYRREVKKIKSRGLFEGQPLPSSWGYYERLSFLKPEISTRQHRRSTRVRVSSESDTAGESTVTHESLPDENDSSSNFEKVMWTYNMSTNEPTQASGSSNGITKADLILQRLQRLSSAIAKSQKDETKDEDYMFFMSVLPMVRNLHPMKKLQLRVKINEWLMQALSDTDPLNQVQYADSCEDSKVTIVKEVMESDDDD